MGRFMGGTGVLGVASIVLAAGACSVDERGVTGAGGATGVGGVAGDGSVGGAASGPGSGTGGAQVPAHFETTRGNMIPPGGPGALLPDGRVFILNDTGAQTFDPATGTFTFAGNLITPRWATAAVLADGRVLVAGGEIVVDNHTQPLAETEIYDFARGAFVPGPPMTQPRGSLTATRMHDGRILVVCGDTAEVLDAAATAFTPVGNTTVTYYGHSAVLLADGRVMVAGGNDPRSVGGGQRAEVNLFDPATNTFRETSPLQFGNGTGLVALPDGRALKTGGYFGFEKSDGATTWEPVNESVTSVGPMLEANIGTDGTVLSDGRVLFTFGASSELFDPATNTFSPGPAPAPGPFPSGVLLRDGRVLFTANLVHEPIPATLFVPATP